MFAQSVDSNGTDLPPALPWVEPSLNNLWLEACSSHLCGNYQAAIITTSVLLEFTLRMVVSNLDEVPSIRKDHGEMFENQTLRPVINSAKSKGLLSGNTKKWWEAYCEHIRNKICHGDLLHILDDCRDVPQFVDYFNPIESRVIQSGILTSKLLHILRYFIIRQAEDSQSIFSTMPTASYPNL